MICAHTNYLTVLQLVRCQQCEFLVAPTRIQSSWHISLRFRWVGTAEQPRRQPNCEDTLESRDDGSLARRLVEGGHFCNET